MFETVFPNTNIEPFSVTSPATNSYNCIAWAYGDDSRWYWPDGSNIYYWPDDIPRLEEMQSFISLFEKIGYEICDNGELEVEYEKIVLFRKDDKPTHAARQLLNGMWTSKLGRFFDVSHSIFSIENGEYGEASIFMRRIK